MTVFPGEKDGYGYRGKWLAMPWKGIGKYGKGKTIIKKLEICC